MRILFIEIQWHGKILASMCFCQGKMWKSTSRTLIRESIVSLSAYSLHIFKCFQCSNSFHWSFNRQIAEVMHEYNWYPIPIPGFAKEDTFFCTPVYCIFIGHTRIHTNINSDTLNEVPKLRDNASVFRHISFWNVNLDMCYSSPCKCVFKTMQLYFINHTVSDKSTASN